MVSYILTFWDAEGEHKEKYLQIGTCLARQRSLLEMGFGFNVRVNCE